MCVHNSTDSKVGLSKPLFFYSATHCYIRIDWLVIIHLFSMSAFSLGIAVIPIGVPVDLSLSLVHALKGTTLHNDTLLIPSSVLKVNGSNCETTRFENPPFIFLLTSQRDPKENLLYEIRHGCFSPAIAAPDYSNGYVLARDRSGYCSYTDFVFLCTSPSPAFPGYSALEWRTLRVGKSFDANVHLALLQERMDELERMVKYLPGGPVFQQAAQSFERTKAQLDDDALV